MDSLRGKWLIRIGKCRVKMLGGRNWDTGSGLRDRLLKRLRFNLTEPKAVKETFKTKWRNPTKITRTCDVKKRDWTMKNATLKPRLSPTPKCATSLPSQTTNLPKNSNAWWRQTS